LILQTNYPFPSQPQWYYLSPPHPPESRGKIFSNQFE